MHFNQHEHGGFKKHLKRLVALKTLSLQYKISHTDVMATLALFHCMEAKQVMSFNDKHFYLLYLDSVNF